MALQEEYRDKHVSFTLSLSGDSRLSAVFTGKGSNPGTRRFIELVEKGIGIVGEGNLRVLMDMQQLGSVPIRSQMMMGKWLLSVKSRIGKVAVVGGGSLARTLSKSAGMEQVRFFEQRNEAVGWLG